MENKSNGLPENEWGTSTEAPAAGQNDTAELDNIEKAAEDAAHTDMPEAPAAAPEVPETSTAPEAPEILATPEVPETPAAPETPETPAAPEAPAPPAPQPVSPWSLQPPCPPAGEARYRWSYDGQQAHNKKRRSGGVLTYAIIMTIAFCVCLVTLLGVVLMESGYLTPPVTRTIFVREYDSESGVLTVPEIIVKCKPWVVGIECKSELTTSEGSGIIIAADGYIATNAHVIEGVQSCTVRLLDGTEYEAEVVGSDELTDLALLKINAHDLDVAELGDSDALLEGETVVAIGNPAGLEFANTATDGIISAVSRNVKIYDASGIMTKRMTLIQTNAAVSPGNSGGPLINDRGQVIGIVNMKYTKTNYEGIGFAIPINGAMEVLDEIKQTGSYSGGAIASKRPLIGITAGGIAQGDEYTLNDGTKIVAEVSGVIVTELTPGLDAANKLCAGDIITEVDGIAVSTIYDVMDIVNEKLGGDTITVKYYRNGVYSTVVITLGTEG